MKILLLTDSYPPEIRSAAVLMQELAEGLAVRGHEVHVCTLRPKYNLAGNGRLNGGPPSHRTENGVHVIRVTSLPVHNVPLWLRGLGELTLPWTFVNGSWPLADPDVVNIYSPPLTLGLAGVALRAARRAPVVLNVQDLFPQHAIDVGILKNPLLIRGYTWMERLVYASADKILVHSPGNKKFLVEQKNLSSVKVDVLPNWVDLDQPGRAEFLNFRARWGLGVKFVLLFGGVMGRTQGLEVVVDAAHKLRAHPDIIFLLVGDGAAKARLEQQVNHRQLGNVLFKPFLEPAAYRSLLNEADAGFLTLSPDVKTPVVPSKLLGFMAAGKPYIASLNRESDAVTITSESGAGLCVTAGDAAAFSQAVLQLHGNRPMAAGMGLKGRDYVQAHFSKDVCLKRYEALLIKCATARSRYPDAVQGRPILPALGATDV